MRINTIDCTIVLLLIGCVAAQAVASTCSSKNQGNDGAATCMISFVQNQISQDGLTATFKNADKQPLVKRADVYDSALALILLLENGKTNEARPIADALVNVVEPDGRARASYATSRLQAEDRSVNLGSLSFQIIALARYHLVSQQYKYLETALKIGDFIRKYLASSDMGGYFGGFSPSGVKFTWISVEQNIALYAAARLLNSITSKQEWRAVMSNTANLIKHAWDNKLGRYALSVTKNTVDSRDSVNAQTWAALLDSEDIQPQNTQRALQWVINNALDREDVNGHDILGVKFSTRGIGPVTEVGASTAIALRAKPLLKSYYDQLVNSFSIIQRFATGSDGSGLVAAFNTESAGDSSGFFPYLQTASTAWAALAIQSSNNEFANPFADYTKKRKSGGVNLAKLKSLAVSNSGQEQVNESATGDDTRTIALSALVIASVSAGFCVIFSIAVLGVNFILCSRFFRRFIEEEERREEEMKNQYNFQPTKVSPGSAVISPITPATPITPLTLNTSGIGANALRINTSPSQVTLPNRLLSPPAVDRLESPKDRIGSPSVFVPGSNISFD